MIAADVGRASLFATKVLLRIATRHVQSVAGGEVYDELFDTFGPSWTGDKSKDRQRAAHTHEHTVELYPLDLQIWEVIPPYPSSNIHKSASSSRSALDEIPPASRL